MSVELLCCVLHDRDVKLSTIDRGHVVKRVDRDFKWAMKARRLPSNPMTLIGRPRVRRLR
ncbi:MAG TPA: hypothetical protein VK272_08380 [Solirubrobacteraceae bacterium]|nr:hypothetical protein [Solirubrobacteraceae bacterium]